MTVEEKRAYLKQWRENIAKDPDKRLARNAYAKQWRKDNSEAYAFSAKFSYEKNKEKILQRQKENPTRLANSKLYWKTHATRIKNMKQSKKQRIFELLGNKCVCCNSLIRLEIDHILPRNSNIKYHGGTNLYKAVFENPSSYQLLCRECNRWKDNGPCCPCQWWDKIMPDWRQKITPKILTSLPLFEVVGLEWSLGQEPPL